MLTYLYDPAGVLHGPVELPITPGIGVQLPGNAIELPEALPSASVDHVWVWRDGRPQQLVDRRGPVFRTKDGQQQEWGVLGELPEGYTLEGRPGPFHVWQGNQWMLDSVAEKDALVRQEMNKRDTFLTAASTRIAPLQDAIDLGEATPSEEAELLEWKRYRVELNRVHKQEGFPQNIQWPSMPDQSQY
ncbi:tail fiber assembly protein [Pseudomonas vranovensis]|uniref:tail fiber assembly protein n=1 Tax=Pseudomonas vranovensis TaxID=321661 RepID=UPI003D95DC18